MTDWVIMWLFQMYLHYSTYFFKGSFVRVVIYKTDLVRSGGREGGSLLQMQVAWQLVSIIFKLDN